VAGRWPARLPVAPEARDGAASRTAGRASCPRWGGPTKGKPRHGRGFLHLHPLLGSKRPNELVPPVLEAQGLTTAN